MVVALTVAALAFAVSLVASAAPKPAPSLTFIAAGLNATCAVTAEDRAMCWGRNGELRNGSRRNSGTPVDVAGLGRVTAIAPADGFTCALTRVGGVKCWGDNTYGQLGNGSKSARRTPVDVVGLRSGVRAIAVGWDHACAITRARGVKCWGDNGYGQLGHGAKGGWSLTPVDVVFAARQMIALRPSGPAGSIARGTSVTFTATVRPLSPAGSPARVRFEVYRSVAVSGGSRRGAV